MWGVSVILFIFTTGKFRKPPFILHLPAIVIQTAPCELQLDSVRWDLMRSEHALCKQGLIRIKKTKQTPKKTKQSACCGDLFCLFVHTYCTHITTLRKKYSHFQPQCTASAPRQQLNVWWDSLKTHSLKIFRYSLETLLFILSHW